jgi:DNA-binding XRE family transcriptional regulator
LHNAAYFNTGAGAKAPDFNMSENNTIYNVTSDPTTIEGFANRPCANSFASGNYQPPTLAELRALRKFMSWSQNDVAKIVGVSFNPDKGSTTVRRWETASDKKDSREIPYAAWRLLLLHAKVVKLDDEI